MVTVIRDMVHDRVEDLGLELGLGHTTLRGMSRQSIHTDTAYNWLMCCDNVLERSGKPTWQALSRALARMKCHGVIDKIAQSE